MSEIDFDAVDHAEEVMELLNIPVERWSYQDRTELGRKLLQLASRRLIPPSNNPKGEG